MINVNKLRGKIVENNLTREEVAEHLGMCTKTLTTRLNKGVFNNIEIEKLTELLNIDNPIEIFLPLICRNKTKNK